MPAIASWSILLGGTLSVSGNIPQHKPLALKQNGLCLDQDFHSEPDRLIRHWCNNGRNQEFVWREKAGGDYFHFISNLDDRCIGINDADADGSGRPEKETPISFKNCNESDVLIRWKYRFGTQQLQLANFPDLCMDFSDRKSLFTVWRCKDDLGKDNVNNQRVELADTFHAPMYANMPVMLRHIGDPLSRLTPRRAWWAGKCLTQHVINETAVDFTLTNCRQSSNQLFAWNSEMNRIVSSTDGRCIAALGTEPNTPLTLQDCDNGDAPFLWRYATGIGQIKLEERPDLCLGVMNNIDSLEHVGLVACGTSHGKSMPELHFQVVDLGRRAIEEDLPLKIEQNGLCVVQDQHNRSGRLARQNCTLGKNQDFVWRGDNLSSAHVLVNSRDNTCMGLVADGNNTTPTLGSQLAFRACNKSDDMFKWVYAYGPQQLRLQVWPEFCMELTNRSNGFIIARCRFEEYSHEQRVAKNVFTQRVTLSSSLPPSHDQVPNGLPVAIHAGRSLGNSSKRLCLERSPKDNGLLTSLCPPDIRNSSIYQMFEFRWNRSWHFSHLLSILDDQCLGVSATNLSRIDVGNAVEFKTCNESDRLARWVYSYELGSLRLADWPHLCLEGNSSSKQVVMESCKDGNATTTNISRNSQTFKVVDMRYSRIEENVPLTIKQNGWCLDQPFKPQANPHLRLHHCHGQANQLFVWHKHMLMSHINNTCIGVRGGSNGTQKKPHIGAQVTFLDCADEPHTRWTFAYGTSHLKMREWPDLCLDFDVGHFYFIVTTCRNIDLHDGLGLLPARAQVIKFEGVVPSREGVFPSQGWNKTNARPTNRSVNDTVQQFAMPSMTLGRTAHYLLTTSTLGTSRKAMVAVLCAAFVWGFSVFRRERDRGHAQYCLLPTVGDASDEERSAVLVTE